jgi:hypothetical protein
MKITITGIPPYDGEYEVDFARLTSRDLHDVKRISGHMPLDIEDAADRGDTDLGVAFAVVALKKHGFQRINEDALWDAELGAIRVDMSDSDEAEGDAVPPPSETVTPSTPSGSPSSSVSELRPASPPPSTGTPSSGTPASDQAISGT